MKSNVWRWLLIPVVALAVAAVILAFLIPRKPAVQPVSALAEKAAADLLLKEKLSGPRYFNSPAEASPEDGEFWIRVFEARSQVPRIVAERKLSPEGANKVDELIDEMTEHHPSRAVGGMRINLMRLNMSLDSIK